MAISDLLTQLNNVKQAIKQAISNKGVNMNNVPFTEYASKINSIPVKGALSYTVLADYPHTNYGGVTHSYTYRGGYDFVIADLSMSASKHFPSGEICTFYTADEKSCKLYMNLPSGSTFTVKTNDGYNHHTQMKIVGIKCG